MGYLICQAFLYKRFVYKVTVCAKGSSLFRHQCHSFTNVQWSITLFSARTSTPLAFHEQQECVIYVKLLEGVKQGFQEVKVEESGCTRCPRQSKKVGGQHHQNLARKYIK